MLGYYQAAISLGIIAGTWLGGQFFAITPTLPYVIGGLLLLITVLPCAGADAPRAARR